MVYHPKWRKQKYLCKLKFAGDKKYLKYPVFEENIVGNIFQVRLAFNFDDVFSP